MAAQRTTLADVAREAGLSKTAVSFALNNPEGSRLSADAIRRATEAAKKLNYRPNFAARTLRTQQTTSIGFLSTEVAVTRFAMPMISGALRQADLADHTLLIAETAPDLDGHNKPKTESRKKIEARALAALLDRQIDGLIVAEMGAKQIDAPAVDANLAIVYLNALGPEGSVSILPDEAAAGAAVVDELLSGKFRDRIMIIGVDHGLETNPNLSVTIGTRVTSIRNRLKQNAVLEWQEVPGAIWGPELGRQAILEASKKGKVPDAVIALNDPIAIGVYQACAELGLVVGKDLSVVSFDDDEYAQYLVPALTTARLPYSEMGSRAVSLVLSPETRAGVQLVPMPLQIRSSVAK